MPTLAAAGPAARPVLPRTVARHLEWMRQRGLAEGTIDKRRRTLARLAAWTGGPVWEATPETLAAWRESLTSGTCAVFQDLVNVRQFYRWAVAERILLADPTARIPMPRLPRRLPRPVSEAQLAAALDAAPARIRPMLVLAAWAGLRAKEIALLRRECVLETGTPPALLIADYATKGRRERIVPMSEFVAAEIVPVLPASGWVFPRRDGRPGPLTPNGVSHLCNTYLHEAGIAASLHQLRHRFGTAAYHASKDLRVVQELLGHQSPATTAGYAAYSNGAALAAVQAIPAPRPAAEDAGPSDTPGQS